MACPAAFQVERCRVCRDEVADGVWGDEVWELSVVFSGDGEESGDEGYCEVGFGGKAAECATLAGEEFRVGQDSEVGKALLGSPNGSGVGFM